MVFKSKYFPQLDETVILSVPALLPPEVIARVHSRKELNRTFNGEKKHDYLLSKFIFCGTCGNHIAGYANRLDTLYYRHHTKAMYRSCSHYNGSVRADILESAVLYNLIQTFGDVQRIQAAVKAANPDQGQRNDLINEKQDLEKTVHRASDQITVIIEKISLDVITETEADNMLNKLRSEKQAAQSRIDAINNQLENLPDPVRVRKLGSMASKVFINRMKSPQALKTMTFEQRRKLIETAFTGFDSNGNKLGVYLTKQSKGNYSVEIRGLIESMVFDWSDVEESASDYSKMITNAVSNNKPVFG